MNDELEYKYEQLIDELDLMQIEISKAEDDEMMLEQEQEWCERNRTYFDVLELYAVKNHVAELWNKYKIQRPILIAEIEKVWAQIELKDKETQ